jgi:hypothetical protein
MDNREAMAYLLFRRFKCSRVVALEAVEELAEMFPGIAKVAVRRWRPRRTKRPGTEPGRTTPEPR